MDVDTRSKQSHTHANKVTLENALFIFKARRTKRGETRLQVIPQTNNPYTYDIYNLSAHTGDIQPQENKFTPAAFSKVTPSYKSIRKPSPAATQKR